MKVGDLVKHKRGTLAGYGIVLRLTDGVDENSKTRRIDALWYCHGNTTFQSVAAMYLEVKSESR